MAMNIYAQLLINGESLTGDVTAGSMGGHDITNGHIEAFAFYHEAGITPGATHRDAATVNHGPISFTKRPDRSTPLLLQAMIQQRKVDGAIKFFIRAPGTGETILGHVLEIAGGQILGIRTEMLNALTPEGGPMPVLERITLRYANLKIVHVPSSTQFETSAR
jgi:type VI secretion system secreted protein Hcp